MEARTGNGKSKREHSRGPSSIVRLLQRWNEEKKKEKKERKAHLFLHRNLFTFHEITRHERSERVPERWHPLVPWALPKWPSWSQAAIGPKHAGMKPLTALWDSVIANESRGNEAKEKKKEKKKRTHSRSDAGKKEPSPSRANWLNVQSHPMERFFSQFDTIWQT